MLTNASASHLHSNDQCGPAPMRHTAFGHVTLPAKRIFD